MTVAFAAVRESLRGTKRTFGEAHQRQAAPRGRADINTSWSDSYELVAGTPGEGRDGLTLTLVAILVGADVGGRARPQIRDRRRSVLPRHCARAIAISCTSVLYYSGSVTKKAAQKHCQEGNQLTLYRLP